MMDNQIYFFIETFFIINNILNFNITYILNLNNLKMFLPIPTRLLTIYGAAVKLILSVLAPKCLAKYVGSHCMII